jgi:hypothetical protein
MSWYPRPRRTCREPFASMANDTKFWFEEIIDISSFEEQYNIIIKELKNNTKIIKALENRHAENRETQVNRHAKNREMLENTHAKNREILFNQQETERQQLMETQKNEYDAFVIKYRTNIEKARISRQKRVLQNKYERDRLIMVNIQLQTLTEYNEHAQKNLTEYNEHAQKELTEYNEHVQKELTEYNEQCINEIEAKRIELDNLKIINENTTLNEFTEKKINENYRILLEQIPELQQQIKQYNEIYNEAINAYTYRDNWRVIHEHFDKYHFNINGWIKDILKAQILSCDRNIDLNKEIIVLINEVINYEKKVIESMSQSGGFTQEVLT